MRNPENGGDPYSKGEGGGSANSSEVQAGPEVRTPDSFSLGVWMSPWGEQENVAIAPNLEPDTWRGSFHLGCSRTLGKNDRGEEIGVASRIGVWDGMSGLYGRTADEFADRCVRHLLVNGWRPMNEVSTQFAQLHSELLW